MKISIADLRVLIREAMKMPDTKSGLAMFMSTDESEMTQLVVYDANFFSKSLLDTLVDAKIPVSELGVFVAPCFRDSIVGAIRGEDSGTPEDVTLITRVSAKKGYGPSLYDLMSSMRGFISPDPVKTSLSAVGIWKYYRESRPDVLVKQTNTGLHEDPSMDFKVSLRDSGGARSMSKALQQSNDEALDSLVKSLRGVVLGTDLEIYNAIRRKMDNVSNEMLENSV